MCPFSKEHLQKFRDASEQLASICTLCRNLLYIFMLLNRTISIISTNQLHRRTIYSVVIKALENLIVQDSVISTLSPIKRKNWEKKQINFCHFIINCVRIFVHQMIIICFLDVIKYVTNKWEQIQNSFKTKFESFRNQNQLKKDKIVDNLMLRSIILAAKKLNNKNDDGISVKTKKGNLSW